ncbi:MAG: hypothetical protein GY819_06470 [Planctomycetaceae bacterium]|nr:hypothetical protein [Planctomycetaceae bacterium]MCP4462428.1 hypothetical protein [Planctomycetaceae bacterium]MDG1809365.1 hypothetical protein [Pirellulaceae bacterium]MDG2104200.1 hypothetical protein [Pirellulaceae bacterium]
MISPPLSKTFAEIAQRKANWLVALSLCFLAGCGTTNQRIGTEQLLMSDAVDLAVSQIDFSLLKSERVYLDGTYLQSVKGFGFVNAPYIISSLRQQLTAAGCMLQDNRDDADVIVEARVGALGTDGHEVIYGVPKNNLLNSAATVLPNMPTIPAIPEMSVARIDAQTGIAKIMVFAYESTTRRRIWQSGVARAESTSRNSWLMGAGPFQRGTVHEGTKFAGEKIDPKLDMNFSQPSEEELRLIERYQVKPVGYFEEFEFVEPAKAEEADKTEEGADTEEGDNAEAAAADSQPKPAETEADKTAKPIKAATKK